MPKFVTGLTCPSCGVKAVAMRTDPSNLVYWCEAGHVNVTWSYIDGDKTRQVFSFHDENDFC